MIKIELTYSPYNIKLSKPFSTSRGEIKERLGIIVKLKDINGNTGIGDAAPFPEFGSESLEDTAKRLENMKLEIKIDLDNVEKSIDLTLHPFDSLPSLRSGLEQALLNLICKAKGITLNQLLGRSSLKLLNINAVLGIMTPMKSAEAAAEYLSKGYSCLKLKIGRRSFFDDLECLKAVKKQVNESLRIRVDVNGKWNIDEAIEYSNALEEFNLEFIEQPVSRLEDFIKLKGKTNIPIAADESIRSIKDANSFMENKASDILILKPMMIGGIIPALKIIEKASKRGIGSVISSSFESVVGRSFAVFLASLVHENIAHGLSTAGYFKEDLFEDPFPIRDGKIFL